MTFQVSKFSPTSCNYRAVCYVATVTDNVHHTSAARYNAGTNVTDDHRSATKARHGDGVAAQLVISMPVISWASLTPNPRRRIVCVAPKALQFQSPAAPAACLTAVSRDHARTPTSKLPPETSSDRRRNTPQLDYNYGRSWYDGLDQLD